MAEPANLKEALSAFHELPLEIREKVVVGFEQARTAISFSDLGARLSLQTGVQADLLTGLAKGLGSFVMHALGDADFRSTLARIFTESIDGIMEDDMPVMASLVERLLQCESSIGLTSKTHNIIWGHGKTFRTAHVVTQIRPVFARDLTRPIESAAIVHELQIEFNENSTEQSICMLLDRDQILRFRQVLKRAIDKEEGLRSSSQGIRYLMSQDDEVNS